MLNMADLSNDAWHQPDILPLQNEVARTNFAGVLATINIPAAGRFASKIRQSSQYSTSQEGTHFNNISDASIPCRVLKKPMHGTFNIVFELKFQDGVSWMLKVPANGHGNEFCTLSQNALISEARTMQMIRSETTVPVPRVYAFEPSVNNELGVPFILMQKIDGLNLGVLWFDSTENFRTRVLQDLAAAMVQLQKFNYDRSGSLSFDVDGKLAGIGPMKIEDGIHYMDGSHKYKPAEGPLWSAKGPLADAKSCYLFTLDRLANGVPEFDSCDPGLDSYSRGLYKSLRLFIDWACQINAQEGQHFVLSHTDLDLQNIIVGEDGTVRGIIDWDGAASVPREVGCLSPPKWLMADWLKDFLESQGYPSVNVKECESYRARYAQMVESEIERTTDRSLGPTSLDSLSRRGAEVTSRSVLMRNLDIAANYANMSPYIMEYIHYQIESLTSEDWSEGPPELPSCWQHNSQTQSPETENYEETETNHNRDDISKYGAEKVERVLFEALAKVGESLVQSSQLPETPSRSSEGKRLEFSLEDLKGDPFTELETFDPSKTRASSHEAKALQFCCGMGEKGLRRLAKVFYREVENDRETKITAKTRTSTTVGKKATLAWVWQKLLRMIESLRKKIINLAKPSFGSHPANFENSSTDKGETKATQRAHIEIDEDVLGEEVRGKNVEDVRDEVQKMPHNGLEKVTRISTQADIDASLTKEIANISARRRVLLNADEEKQRDIKRIAEAAAKNAKQLVWDQIAIEVETNGIQLDFLQTNQSKIVAGIINAFQEDEREQMELFTPQSVSQAAKIPVSLNDIEDRMFRKAQASNRRPAFEFISMQTGKIGTAMPDDDVPKAMVETIDLDVANQKLRSVLGILRAEHEVTIPRETQETTCDFSMGNQKLEALLGLATSGLKNQQGRVNDLEAASCQRIEAELIANDAVDSRTPSPDGDQEGYIEASTGFTTPEAAFFQEPKDDKREMASPIEGNPRATEFNDFVRGLLDGSKQEVESLGIIAEWEEKGTNEMNIEHHEDTHSSTRDLAITPFMTAKSAKVMPPFTNDGKPISRNKPCPCGSRHKYKKCCGAHQKYADEAMKDHTVPLDSGHQVFSNSRYSYEDLPESGNRENKEPLQPEVEDPFSHLPRFAFQAPAAYGSVGDRDAIALKIEGCRNAYQNGECQNASQVCETSGERNQEETYHGISIEASNGLLLPNGESDAVTDSDKCKEDSEAKNQMPMHNQLQGGLDPHREAVSETPVRGHGYRYVAGEYPAQVQHFCEEEDIYHNEENWEDGCSAEWTDDGTYTAQNVCMLLDRGELDELRLLRLKQGFFMLMQKLGNP